MYTFVVHSLNDDDGGGGDGDDYDYDYDDCTLVDYYITGGACK